MPNNAKVTLIGNLTRDPIQRNVGQSTVVSLSVAVNTLNKKSDGSYETNFYDVSVWGKSGDYVMNSFQKGTQVWVTGDLMMTEYTQKDSGQTRQALRVTATDIRGMNRLKQTPDHGKPQETKNNDDEMPF